MRIDLNISIDQTRIKPAVYILKWNPDEAEYRFEHYERDLGSWAEGFWDFDFDWEIDPKMEPEAGDRFFLVKVGRGPCGLVAAGRFQGEPFWGGGEAGTHKIGLEFEMAIHPERSEIVTLEQLQDEIGEFDWDSTCRMGRLEGQSADRIELMWRDFVGANKSLHLPRAARNHAYSRPTEIDKAIAFASKAHAADLDLDGNPTILHALAVGMMGRTNTERVVGFLHDVVEDTHYDFSDLRAEGFSEEVIETLRLLTHDKQTPYMAYVERICQSGNRVALQVKCNDLQHNIARGRAGGHTRCVERHLKAVEYINRFRAAHEPGA